MPVTIGTLTSNVNVVDGNNMMNDEMLERIVRLAVARLKAEMRSDEASREEQEVRDRRSESDPF